jgi:hypothetical protein
VNHRIGVEKVDDRIGDLFAGEEDATGAKAQGSEERPTRWQ